MHLDRSLLLNAGPMLLLLGGIGGGCADGSTPVAPWDADAGGAAVQSSGGGASGSAGGGSGSPAGSGTPNASAGSPNGSGSGSTITPPPLATSGQQEGGTNPGSGSPSSGGSRSSGGSVARPGMDAGNPPLASDASATTPAGTCKRGIAYEFGISSAAGDLGALAPASSWFYTWGTTPGQLSPGVYDPLKVEFVPMIWGHPITDVAAVAAQIPPGAKYLLGFNEPNFAAQSNLTPAQAAARWPQLEQIATMRNLKLVSPAVNFCAGACNETDPLVWMDKFLAACTGCRVDHIAIHWYACTQAALKYEVDRFKKYGKPIWVTEFDCADNGPQSMAAEQAYMKAALAYLEGEPQVFRYSWFAGRTTAIKNVDLLAGGGQLTPLGKDYVSLPPGSSCTR